MSIKQIRFPPDSDQIGFISFNLNEFKKELSALILNESASGACLIVNKALVPKIHPIEASQILLVQIGKMSPLKGQVRWVKEIDESLFKIGIELLE